MPTINIVCRRTEPPWLFDDLRNRLAGAWLPEHQLSSSCEPDPEADAYIFIRASETQGCSPEILARSVVQIHDVADDLYDKETGERRGVHLAGALSLTQPVHQIVLGGAGVDLSSRPVLVMPIGAGDDWRPRSGPPPVFSLGWVGRPARWRGIDWKRLGEVVRAFENVARLTPFRAVLAGQCEDLAHELGGRGIPVLYSAGAPWDSVYHEMDALVSFSRAFADAVPVFEALRCGVPVIRSPGGWADFPEYCPRQDLVYTVRSEWEIAAAAWKVGRTREAGPWNTRSWNGTIESWIEANLALAAGLVP